MANVYFDLTAAFNQLQPTAALASGPAVVFYRIAIMSKDGDYCRSQSLAELPIDEAHLRLIEAAERLLPQHPLERDDADAQ